MSVKNCKTFKEYSKSPLPFEGNKKLWRKNYKDILKDFEDVSIHRNQDLKALSIYSIEYSTQK